MKNISIRIPTKKISKVLQRIASLKLNITKPEAVTLSDCILAHQMGYSAITSAGRLVEFKKERGTRA